MPCSKWLAKYFTEHLGLPFVLVLFAACPSCLFSHGCSCRREPVAQRQAAGAQRGEQLSQDPVNETSCKWETAPSPWDSPGRATHCRGGGGSGSVVRALSCSGDAGVGPQTSGQAGEEPCKSKPSLQCVRTTKTSSQRPKAAQPAFCWGVLGQGPPGSPFQSTPVKAAEQC